MENKEKIIYSKDGDGYIMYYIDVPEDMSEFEMPEDSTFNPPPEEYIEGYHYSIKGSEWISVKDAPLPPLSLEHCRDSAMLKFKLWEEKYLNSPFVHEGEVYLHDEKFREMMISSTLAYREYDGRLPKGWFTATGKLITPVTKEWLDKLGEAAYTSFEDKTMEAGALLYKIRESDDCEYLANITFPKVCTVEELANDLKKVK